MTGTKFGLGLGLVLGIAGCTVTSADNAPATWSDDAGMSSTDGGPPPRITSTRGHSAIE